MTNFIGRNDFVDPVFSDPTWGVSDQDMFNRGLEELKAREGGKPFYALLQTLSNHTPYALPTPLPVEKVTDRGSLNEHLTAMNSDSMTSTAPPAVIQKLKLLRNGKATSRAPICSGTT
eukprot:gene18404-biopygen15511